MGLFDRPKACYFDTNALNSVYYGQNSVPFATKKRKKSWQLIGCVIIFNQT